MFETRANSPLPRTAFLRRFALYFGLASFVMVASLAMGVVGYHWFEGWSWIDSLLNASMILGGMGPVDPVKTYTGKLFASFYALYSGMIFLAAAGILLAPVAHRILHRFHCDLDDEQPRQS